MTLTDAQVDVVIAGESPNRTIATSAKCPICRFRLTATDAVIRIEQYDVDVQVGIHRRCMEKLLANSVEDLPTEEARFQDYRAKVADKLDLVLIG